MTTQTELRQAIDYMKDQSGSGSKARKQERFRKVYKPAVAHIVAGERYDDAGVGPATAQSAVETVYPELDHTGFSTLSEALASVDSDGNDALDALVKDLDTVAENSGNEQEEALSVCLRRHKEPSLVTLALLDDENIGLGTSQMREAFFDGTRDERKHREAFTETTAEFIRLARRDALPTRPVVGKPFSPMLAVSESRGRPENPVAQTKLDGYRIIVHVKQEEVGPKAYAFSRAKNNVTESLPELNEIDWPDQGEYILDGEILAEDGSYSTTSERVGRKRENIDDSTEMNFHLFDILVDDGRYIADQEFRQRHNQLVSFVANLNDDRVRHLGLKHDIDMALDEAMENGDEGIIVKDLTSEYTFGKRSANWQKVKIDNETVDVVIAGFEEGDGDASGTLGNVRLESSDGVHVGNSGSGFSDAQREKIWQNQGEWMGRTIEVEARGLGSQGKLRMPIFKRVRDEGEPDSFDRISEVMKDV